MSKKKTTEEFKVEVFNLVGDEYQVLGEYIDAKTKIKMLHNKCGNIYEVTPDNFLQCKRCPICCISPQQVKIGYNSMFDTNPELAKLLLNPEDGYKYTQNSNKKLDWKCHNCSEIIKNISPNKVNKHGLSCPSCSDGISYPNRLMFSVLNNLYIDFKPEKSFEWCRYVFDKKVKKGIYDFYFKLNNQEYVIEMDGYFHFNYNPMNGKTKEESQQIDSEKDRLAIEHNILPIRINCEKLELEYIKTEILNSNLKDILNLSKIDWQECERKSLTSLKLQACELWKLHHNTKIISKKMKRNRSTVIDWLKSCSSAGLCDYEPIMGCPKSFCIKVICIETKEIFRSITDASKKYNINKSNISACCKGKLKSAGQLADGTKLHWQLI